MIRQGLLQDKRELELYIDFVKSLGINSYLEIGSFQGDSLYSVLTNANPKCLGIAIDKQVLEVHVDKQRYLGPKKLNKTIKELNSLGYNTKALIGDSKDPKIIAKAKSEGPYDLLFIDGDHSYSGVKADWDNYSSLAKVIVLHDVYQPMSSGLVKQFWEDLKARCQFKETREIYTLGSQMGYGIAIKD